MINALKLKYRILLGYSVPVLLAMGVAGIVQHNVSTVDKSSKEVKILQSSISEINEVFFAISTIVRNARGHALFPTDHSYDDSYQEGSELFVHGSLALDKLIKSPEQRERFNKVQKLGQELDRNTRKVFELVHQGKIAEAVALTQSVRMNELSKLRREMLEHANNDLNIYSKQQESAVYWLNTVVWLGAAVSGILAIGIGIVLASRISETINQAVTKITESSSAIATTTEEQERIATQQATAVNQTTATMDELGASSRQASEQAESVVNNARQILLLAEEGSKGAHQVLDLAEEGAAGARQVLILTEVGTKVVGQTIEGMSELKNKVEAIAQQIMHLNEQASQIGNITNVVTDIANQTNMLALNAAVEAVRAGESGKGFSVVAAEIRRLADQSKKSAERINTLIGDIQHAISSTVIVTDEGTKNVRETIKFSNETEAAFQGVAQAINDSVLKNQQMTLTAINDIILQNQKASLAAINEIVLRNQQISLNSKQQATAIQQVVEAMNTINIGARETATGISQTKVGTQQLNEAALNLKEIV